TAQVATAPSAVPARQPSKELRRVVLSANSPAAFLQNSGKNSECDFGLPGFAYSSNHRENSALPLTFTKSLAVQGAKNNQSTRDY
ncbi:MAG: hypothetical protein ACREAM_10380, partial [Blastocatellia bacterium]